MPSALSDVVKNLNPNRTVIFFGAGSSVPSGCPSAQTLSERLFKQFGIGALDMSLPELAGLIELKTNDRHQLVGHVRASFNGKRPTGGLLTLPLFDWKALYTTNYDELIEASYSQRHKNLKVFASNFDFNGDISPSIQRLYKIHGTIGKDRSDGHQSSIILTEQDYDQATQHREFIYNRLQSDLAESQLIVIGYSLADPEIKSLIGRISDIQSKIDAAGKLFLLSFERDEPRAEILESRGFKVSFGGVDDFFSELIKSSADHVLVHKESSNPLDAAPSLIPMTEDVSYSVEQGQTNVSAMFSGRSATFRDIGKGLTFERDVISDAYKEVKQHGKQSILILGASGVGKSTAARQLALKLAQDFDRVWEHRVDHSLDAKEWIKVAKRMRELDQKGCLFIDDAHTHLQQINELTDFLSSDNNLDLVLILAAPRNRWNPRIKSPSLLKASKEFRLSRLSTAEIERLLVLAESVPEIRRLVEATFSGFNRLERRRRLVNRCEADTFVCLKNIFASDGFDDIILAEFAGLDEDPRAIYRVVAFLETCGVTVHRQLLIRLLGIPTNAISALLESLIDIVFEMQIEERDGIYVWRGRHAVISSIIAKYKFSDQRDFVAMIERVIGAINPTFAIELRSIRELCSIDSGIAAVVDKGEQNRLLRMMISVAPGERVPRHRLIRNLISSGAYDKAATEIRIFENDFGVDGPVAKYHVSLMLNRARNAPGLLHEDRVAILEDAVSKAARAASRFSLNKSVLAIYCEAGIDYFGITGDPSVFDHAIDTLKASEEKIGDPDIARMIANFEGRLRSRETDAIPEEGEAAYE